MSRLNVARGKRFRRPRPQVVQAPPAPPQEPTVLRGWDDIGAALEVHDSTAQEYAARNTDALPIYYDHAGRPCIRLAALSAWVDRQALFYRTYHVLRAAGKLPGQVRTAGAKAKRQGPIKAKRRATCSE